MAGARAAKLVEIQDLHRRVHEMRDLAFANPLVYIYLSGVEEVLDWLLGSCPDGERADVDPLVLVQDYDWQLALVCGEKSKDASCLYHQIRRVEVS